MEFHGEVLFEGLLDWLTVIPPGFECIPPFGYCGPDFPVIFELESVWFSVINGDFYGEMYGLVFGRIPFVDVFTDGTWCSTMAMTPGLPILERFIEPDTITVKQLPSMSDLSVVKLECVKNGDPQLGEQVCFAITADNLGPSDATGVQVMDMLPAGLSYDSDSASTGWYNPTTGVWDIGEFADGDSATLDITATITDTGMITNLAVISGDQPDPELSNNASSLTLIVDPTAVTSIEIELNHGLNLISLPLIPGIPTHDPDPDTVLSGSIPALTSADIVYAYDSTWAPSVWRDHVPGVGGSLRDLGPGIDDGLGYWVIKNSAGSATLTIDGVELQAPPNVPSSYDLDIGWNLLGFKSVMPRTAGEYLAGIAGKYTIIYGFENGAYFIVQSADLMEPGLGYWIALVDTGTVYP
jgi:uncharacterized repeat protein (TIGR01451 family)